MKYFFLATVIALLMGPFFILINDYFDAPFDALDPKKASKNPFCTKIDPYSSNLIIIIGLLGISIASFSFAINNVIGIFTLLILILGTFYSLPPFRFKNIPFLDLSIHGLCLGAYFFSLGFFAINFELVSGSSTLFQFFLIFCFIDSAWIHLMSAFSDYDIDRISFQKTTVLFLGKQVSLGIIVLMTLLLILIFPFIYIYNYQPHLFVGIGIFATITVITFLLIISGNYLYQILRIGNSLQKKHSASIRSRLFAVYPFLLFTLLFTNKMF